MKRCFRCLSEKPLESFYKHPSTRDGRLNKCIECTKADVQKNRLDRLEYYREFDRTRGSKPERVLARKAYQKTPEGKLAIARAHMKYERANPTRRKAQIAVSNAVRDGRLKREPCFICGTKAQAHHPNYDAPLSVTWLCPKHHKDAHAVAANDAIARGEKRTNHY